MAPGVKIQSANAGDVKDRGPILGGGDVLGKDVATHSSILAWRIPWTKEPGRLLVHRVTKSQSIPEVTYHTCTERTRDL